MRIIGYLLSCIARILLPRQWQELKIKLQLAYNYYKGDLRQTLNQNLLHALIAGEDHRHFKHRGFDLIAILQGVKKYNVL